MVKRSNRVDLSVEGRLLSCYTYASRFEGIDEYEQGDCKTG